MSRARGQTWEKPNGAAGRGQTSTSIRVPWPGGSGARCGACSARARISSDGLPLLSASMGLDVTASGIFAAAAALTLERLIESFLVLRPRSIVGVENHQDMKCREESSRSPDDGENTVQGFLKRRAYLRAAGHRTTRSRRSWFNFWRSWTGAAANEENSERRHLQKGEENA